MAKSRLPLEERIFVPRPLPQVIVLGDGEAIMGPFCVNCGNQQTIHRGSDDACPVRRLHPLLPVGQREKCTCNPVLTTTGFRHHPDCDKLRYGFNGTVTR
jgi:hypothetical protein